MSTGLLTTQDAAERLGISTRRVIKLITDGRLPATRFGKNYMVKESDLSLVSERKTGRPPKPKASGTDGHVEVRASKKVKGNKPKR
jgi:excisionase family DNA binding protein